MKVCQFLINRIAQSHRFGVLRGVVHTKEAATRQYNV